MARILVTGGTGLIGNHLCNLLKQKGHTVAILSRSKNTNPTTYFWDITKNYIDPKAIKEADFIIHLAGEGIAEKRWSKSRKKALISSRIDSTDLLFNKVKELNPNLKGFISASGIGYYGAITSDKIFNEEDKPGNDFISKICMIWEKSANLFNSIGIRTVIFRTGIVLAKEGGALEKIMKPIKLGFGAAIGTGKQYMPWIHIDDLCSIYAEAIENQYVKGIYNAVSTEHSSNKSFTKSVAEILKKPIWLPNIPTLILKIILGKMAIILLEGSRVSNKKIVSTGFNFNYPTLKTALENLLKQH